MTEDKEKWMEAVFQSMKSSQRAKPRPELLAKIEDRIKDSTSKVIPLHQWRYAAAAAVLILFANTSALLFYNQYEEVPVAEAVVADAYSQSLISNYQIYE